MFGDGYHERVQRAYEQSTPAREAPERDGDYDRKCAEARRDEEASQAREDETKDCPTWYGEINYRIALGPAKGGQS